MLLLFPSLPLLCLSLPVRPRLRTRRGYTEPLVGGSATTLRPEVGSILGCTGTLIHKRHVLTAAHCLGILDYTNIRRALTSSFSVTDSGGTLHSFAVERAYSFSSQDGEFLVNLPTEQIQERLEFTVGSEMTTDMLLIRLSEARARFSREAGYPCG